MWNLLIDTYKFIQMLLLQTFSTFMIDVLHWNTFKLSEQRTNVIHAFLSNRLLRCHSYKTCSGTFHRIQTKQLGSPSMNTAFTHSFLIRYAEHTNEFQNTEESRKMRFCVKIIWSTEANKDCLSFCWCRSY